jgi:hypothetical protein
MHDNGVSRLDLKYVGENVVNSNIILIKHSQWRNYRVCIQDGSGSVFFTVVKRRGLSGSGDSASVLIVGAFCRRYERYNSLHTSMQYCKASFLAAPDSQWHVYKCIYVNRFLNSKVRYVYHPKGLVMGEKSFTAPNLCLGYTLMMP